jgi:hypothetical protein
MSEPTPESSDLPDTTADESDVGWGERPPYDDDDRRLLEERPPHHDRT